MPKYSVMLATFPFGGTECFQARNWLCQLVRTLGKDSRVGTLRSMDVDDTPITMSRNRVLKEAKRQGMDFVLMLDSDMHPDRYMGNAGVKPFWESSFEFMLRHHGPCAVAAPYCGPPPHENVYIFRWATYQTGSPNPDLRLEQYGREEAAIRAGVEEVAALPTGVYLLDMRAIDRIKPPYFEYEYEDAEQTRKASTEDVYFTRNLTLAGVPQYCNWDAWAGHVKRKVVEKPMVVTSDTVRDVFRDSLIRDIKGGERLVDVNPGPCVPARTGCTTGATSIGRLPAWPLGATNG
jgi:hypothetical protein